MTTPNPPLPQTRSLWKSYHDDSGPPPEDISEDQGFQARRFVLIVSVIILLAILSLTYGRILSAYSKFITIENTLGVKLQFAFAKLVERAPTREEGNTAESVAPELQELSKLTFPMGMIGKNCGVNKCSVKELTAFHKNEYNHSIRDIVTTLNKSECLPVLKGGGYKTFRRTAIAMNDRADLQDSSTINPMIALARKLRSQCTQYIAPMEEGKQLIVN